MLLIFVVGKRHQSSKDRGDRDMRLLEALVQRANSRRRVGYDADSCVLHVILKLLPFVSFLSRL